MGDERTTYAAAGVDIEAGDRAVELMKEWVAKTRRTEVVGGLGGFAGMWDASALKTYRRPLLATSTDGVGTKVAIAQRMDVHDTIGFDLVGMVVDDIVVCGAEPLFMTDYIACGRVVPERIAAIVKGIAQACVTAGCALIGGETAEHPGLLQPDEYDLAGATTGVVEADGVLGPERVRPGDVLVAMASSGLHSNGYSLARHLVFDVAGWTLDREVPELGRTIGEELLEPTRIYAQDCLALARTVDLHALSHVTGGGLAANLGRVLPNDLTANIDRSTWTPPPIFSLLGGVGRDGGKDTVGRDGGKDTVGLDGRKGAMGNVDASELERTLNMGIGMIAVMAPAVADEAVSLLASRGVPAWVAGQVQPGDGSATLTGTYAR